MNPAQRLPGDPPQAVDVARMIRVDHAGEYGAARIYAGQLAVLGRRRSAPVIREMQAQERQHLDRFADMITRRRVRPTALLPLWHMAGFALGAAMAYALRPAMASIDLKLLLTPGFAAYVFLGTLALCVGASMISFRKVAALDPAIVFRG